MGYNCQMVDSVFHIKKKKFPALHKDINDYESEIYLAGPLPSACPDKKFLVDVFSCPHSSACIPSWTSTSPKN
jgi:hypothetical protein